MSGEPDATVVVPLTPDEVGWPPMATERLWAWRVGADRYRIANAPWFAPNIGVNDVVIARMAGLPADAGEDATSTPTFVEVAEPSEHVTLRLIVNAPLTLADAAQQLTKLGLWVDGFPHYSMLAVDVPPEADFELVAIVLVEGQRRRRWAWEEGKVTARWRAETAGI